MTELENIQKIQEVIEKYFRDEKVKYFHSSDNYSNIVEDPFLRYEYFSGHRDLILITIGGNNIDETPIKICRTAQQLENLIEAIIY